MFWKLYPTVVKLASKIYCNEKNTHQIYEPISFLETCWRAQRMVELGWLGDHLFNWHNMKKSCFQPAWEICSRSCSRREVVREKLGQSIQMSREFHLQINLVYRTTSLHHKWRKMSCTSNCTHSVVKYFCTYLPFISDESTLHWFIYDYYLYIVWSSTATVLWN